MTYMRVNRVSDTHTQSTYAENQKLHNVHLPVPVQVNCICDIQPITLVYMTCIRVTRKCDIQNMLHTYTEYTRREPKAIRYESSRALPQQH